MLKAVLIATSLAVAMPCFAQQVRVINGDFEHLYGAGGQLLDDADLQARNQRAWEHAQAERQLAIERRRVDIEEERLKLQGAAMAYGMAQSSDGTAQNWDPTAAGDWWYGGGFISPALRIGNRLLTKVRLLAEDRLLAEGRHLAQDGLLAEDRLLAEVIHA
jgi:hypothetical protein